MLPFRTHLPLELNVTISEVVLLAWYTSRIEKLLNLKSYFKKLCCSGPTTNTFINFQTVRTEGG